MIRFHIGFTQKCGVVLKLERFSHLIGLSFGLSSLIELKALSFVLSLRANTYWKRATWKKATLCPKGGSRVNSSQSVSHLE